MAAATVPLRRGLPIPGERTVAGFDAIATTIWPELTTIRRPIRDMFHAAIVLLMKAAHARRAGKDPERAHIVLDPAQIRRFSGAPPCRLG